MAGPEKIPVTTTRIPVGAGDELVCECFTEDSANAEKATELLGREGKEYLNSIEGKKATCVCAVVQKPLKPIKALKENQKEAIAESVKEARSSTFLEPMVGVPKKGLGGRDESIKILRDAFSVSPTKVSQEGGVVEAKFKLLARDDSVSTSDIVTAKDVFNAKFESHLKPRIIKQLKGMGIKNPKVSVSFSNLGLDVSIKIGS